MCSSRSISDALRTGVAVLLTRWSSRVPPRTEATAQYFPFLMSCVPFKVLSGVFGFQNIYIYIYMYLFGCTRSSIFVEAGKIFTCGM